MPVASTRLRPEIVEIHSVADKSYRDAWDQPFEIASLDCGMNQRVRETTRNISFIREEPLLFEPVDPLQWYPRPFCVLPPFQRVEIAKLHDAWHTREMLGKLRHIAAIDDDEVGPQFVKFFPYRGMQFGLIEGRHRERFPTSSALRARTLIVKPLTGAAVTLFA